MDAVYLSPDHAAFVRDEVAAGGYTDADDYVARLIDRQARARSTDKLEALLVEGLKGDATEWTEQDGRALRRLAIKGR